ncbi:hypothetical protein [Azospirillum sp. INR13]|uniref:hypothetical protein n=1 Tax=Azospirillum sp. INR13 TaxID=2596919 RepID=UPI002107CB5E|nr:hypothetical protein [Azospirillum sp. INR13]
MLRSLKTTNIGPAPLFEMDLGDRLTVLTGDNGLGKTLLLDVAWWVCARDWPDGPAIPNRFILPIASREAKKKKTAESTISAVTCGRSGKDVSQDFSFDPTIADWRRNARTRPPIPGLVIYARLDGGFSVWDPARHYYRVAPSQGIDDPDRAPAFHFTKDEVWNGKRVPDAFKGEVTVCEGLERDWLEWEKREPALFDAFVAVLAHLSPRTSRSGPRHPRSGCQAPTCQAFRRFKRLMASYHCVTRRLRSVASWRWPISWSGHGTSTTCSPMSSAPSGKNGSS